MRSLTKNLVEFLKKEDGPTAVEYAVMLALIIVVCIAAITTLGSNANSTFSLRRLVHQADRQLSIESTRALQRVRARAGRPRSRLG